MTKYAKILGLIIFIDTILTATGIHAGIIAEANPLMAAIIARAGIFAFILTKLLFSASCIAAIETLYAREIMPVKRFNVQYFYYKFTIFAYCSIYIVSVLILHLF